MTEPSGAVEAVETEADLLKLYQRFAGETAGKCLALAMSTDHPAPDEVLMGIFQASQDIAQQARSVAATPSDQERRISELEEGLRTASDAINEMFRYFDGGETRGSYDGRPERNQLRKAGYALRSLLSPERIPT